MSEEGKDLVAWQSGPEWSPVVPDSLSKCVSCDEVAVVETIETETFPYGVGEEQVMLSALVPVFSCRACGEQWTDYRGEELRDQTVRRHQADVGSEIVKGSKA